MLPLFDYFMVRVTRMEDAAQLAGLVERLGTGRSATSALDSNCWVWSRNGRVPNQSCNPGD